mmetsp:Transcript_24324/g.38171  ORF Transcript_24324/g.38171 Transcript_24324/m.38171 type:complete len:453 (-) Transcript_24324:551-1909(-)
MMMTSNNTVQEASPLPPAQPSPNRTFYRRTLPSSLTSFSSVEGKEIFASAMSTGGTSAFFSLIEQLQTQPEPAYCGLTTLVIILNALAVDPRRSWKGPWRWYEESMLNCCIDLDIAKKTGITFSTFVCLAKCQGLDVHAVHGSDSTVEQFRQVVKQMCTHQKLPSSFLVISYTRKVLGQTGTGHFSPIGAYDEATDNILILDTARFKYGPHWVPLELVFDALIPEDPDTGKSRGYAVLSYDGKNDEISNPDTICHRCNSPLPLSVLFGSKQNDSLRKEFKHFLESLLSDITLSSVISFWTKDRTNDNYIWELVQPQLQPVDSVDVNMVNSLRQLLKALIAKESLDMPSSLLLTWQWLNVNKGIKSEVSCPPDVSCCSLSRTNGSVRTLEISPGEALYIVYLASLSEEQRRGIVYEDGISVEMKIGVEDTVREQLLAEAALVSYAIETCDWNV